VHEVLEHWGLEETRLVGACSDSAANMKNAITSHLKVPWFYCLAHAMK
jgi:hypothetical protein